MPIPTGVFSAVRISPARYKLRIELVPEKQWGVNLRAEMSATQWAKVSDKVFAAAGGVCEICQGVGSRHPLECHEVWRYDENLDLAAEGRAQILVGLQALCPACHRVKHLGFADKKGWIDASLAHLARVNGISTAEARAYVDWAYKQQRQRARMRFALDLSWFRAHFPGHLRDERARGAG